MKNTNELNNQTTQAFDIYKNEIFVRDIKKRIYDKPFDKTQGFTSELNLRKEIAVRLSYWLLAPIPRWSDIKTRYIELCKKGTLDEVNIAKHKKDLETIAKLYYCGHMITNIMTRLTTDKYDPDLFSNYHIDEYSINHDDYILDRDIIPAMDCIATTDLDVSNYLMALQFKLEGLVGGQKHTNPTHHTPPASKAERFNALKERPIYKYLYEVNEEQPTKLQEAFNMPIYKLADRLFECIVKVQYEMDHTIATPIQYEPFNGGHTSSWDYVYVKDDTITNSAEALSLATQNFNDWLDINLHEQEIGRTLY